jgi:hypothetical protein
VGARIGSGHSGTQVGVALKESTESRNASSVDNVVVRTKTEALEQDALICRRSTLTNIVLVRANEVAHVHLHAELDHSIAKLDEVHVGAGDVDTEPGGWVTDHDLDPIQEESDGSLFDIEVKDLNALGGRDRLEMLAEDGGSDDEGQLGGGAENVALGIDDIDVAAVAKTLTS